MKIHLHHQSVLTCQVGRMCSYLSVQKVFAFYQGVCSSHFEKSSNIDFKKVLGYSIVALELASND